MVKLTAKERVVFKAAKFVKTGPDIIRLASSLYQFDHNSTPRYIIYSLEKLRLIKIISCEPYISGSVTCSACTIVVL